MMMMMMGLEVGGREGGRMGETWEGEGEGEGGEGGREREMEST